MPSKEEIRKELRRKAEANGITFDVDIDSREEMNGLYKCLGIQDDFVKKNNCRALVRENLEQRMKRFNEIRSDSNKKQRTTELVPLPTNTVKPKLKIGNLAERFGGLLDRKTSILECQNALVTLAQGVGDSSLDKNYSQLIALSAPSKAGKTEFLRWIFNNWCTWTDTYSGASTGTGDKPEMNPAGVPTARELIMQINSAIRDPEHHLSDILVLFASFNQTSPYVSGEGPIVETTVERLFRSYVGNVKMAGNNAWQQQRYAVGGKGTFDTIMNHFSALKNGRT